ncbi:hypothetical protein ACFX2C_004419 [Malus domestica]
MRIEAYVGFQLSLVLEVAMGLQILQVAPLPPLTSSSSSSCRVQTLPLWLNQRNCHCRHSRPQLALPPRSSYKRTALSLLGRKDRKLQASSSSSSTTQQDQDDEEEYEDDEEDEEDESDPDPEDLEYVGQIKRVLELLRKNRDMIFSEVKLTVMIEDLREVERRRLLGIEDPDAPTREELADVLEEVNEGKIPKNRLALKLLAAEMNQWPNLEVQITPAKKKPGKSLYARVTDTGIDLQEAAKRLKIDWDTAAEIDDGDLKDENEVPSVLGYGALYLVTAFPVIIGFLLFSTMDYPFSGEMSDYFTLGDLEKQIFVDPISLKESYREVSAAPVAVVPDVAAPKPNALDQLPPLLPPSKPKFLSFSLPNSATSSPRVKKKWKEESQASPRLENLSHLQQEIEFWRTKSCGQRALAPSDDFDLWLFKPNAADKVTTYHSSLSRARSNRGADKNGKNRDPHDDGFTCGALCLFIPGFGGKAKPVRARKVEPDELGNVISRTVSLEKFECGSWASAMINEQEDDTTGHYFDLPLELIRSSVNEAESPISTSFVFGTDRKGALKNASTRAEGWKTHDSSRHVRFSTSSDATSPTACVTPRLRKARDDFKAFLEAQST